MATLRRIILPGYCYHVITVTEGRAPVFTDERNACVVLDALQFLRRRRAYLLGYVLMPDHLHALILPREPWGISQVVKTVKGYSARLINLASGRRGKLWQEEFYERVIRGEAHLLDAVAYLHANPVVAGMVDDPADYAYSSAFPGAQTDVEACV